MRRNDLTPDETPIARLIQSVGQRTPAPDAEFLKRLRETTTAAFLEAHRQHHAPTGPDSNPPDNLLEPELKPLSHVAPPQRVAPLLHAFPEVHALPDASTTPGILLQSNAGHVSPVPDIDKSPVPDAGKSNGVGSWSQFWAHGPVSGGNRSGRNRLRQVRIAMLLVTAVLLAVGFLPDSLVPSRGAPLQVAFENLARADSAEIELKHGDNASLLLVAHDDTSRYWRFQYPNGNVEASDVNGNYFFNSASNTFHVVPSSEPGLDVGPDEKVLDNLNVVDNSVRTSLLRQRPSKQINQDGRLLWIYNFRQSEPENGGMVNVDARVDAQTNELLAINSVVLNDVGEVAFRGEANVLSMNQAIPEDRFQVTHQDLNGIVTNVGTVEAVQGNPSVDDSRLYASFDTSQLLEQNFTLPGTAADTGPMAGTMTGPMIETLNAPADGIGLAFGGGNATPGGGLGGMGPRPLMLGAPSQHTSNANANLGRSAPNGEDFGTQSTPSLVETPQGQTQIQTAQSQVSQSQADRWFDNQGFAPLADLYERSRLMARSLATPAFGLPQDEALGLAGDSESVTDSKAGPARASGTLALKSKAQSANPNLSDFDSKAARQNRAVPAAPDATPTLAAKANRMRSGTALEDAPAGPIGRGRSSNEPLAVASATPSPRRAMQKADLAIEDRTDLDRTNANQAAPSSGKKDRQRATESKESPSNEGPSKQSIAGSGDMPKGGAIGKSLPAPAIAKGRQGGTRGGTNGAEEPVRQSATAKQELKQVMESEAKSNSVALTPVPALQQAPARMSPNRISSGGTQRAEDLPPPPPGPAQKSIQSKIAGKGPVPPRDLPAEEMIEESTSKTFAKNDSMSRKKSEPAGDATKEPGKPTNLAMQTDSRPSGRDVRSKPPSSAPETVSAQEEAATQAARPAPQIAMDKARPGNPAMSRKADESAADVKGLDSKSANSKASVAQFNDAALGDLKRSAQRGDSKSATRPASGAEGPTQTTNQVAKRMRGNDPLNATIDSDDPVQIKSDQKLAENRTWESKSSESKSSASQLGVAKSANSTFTKSMASDTDRELERIMQTQPGLYADQAPERQLSEQDSAGPRTTAGAAKLGFSRFYSNRRQIAALDSASASSGTRNAARNGPPANTPLSYTDSAGGSAGSMGQGLSSNSRFGMRVAQPETASVAPSDGTSPAKGSPPDSVDHLQQQQVPLNIRQTTEPLNRWQRGGYQGLNRQQDPFSANPSASPMAMGNSAPQYQLRSAAPRGLSESRGTENEYATQDPRMTNSARFAEESMAANGLTINGLTTNGLSNGVSNGRRLAEPNSELLAGMVLSTVDAEVSVVRARLANDAEIILGPQSEVILLRPTAVQLRTGELELIVPEGDQVELYGPASEYKISDSNPGQNSISIQNSNSAAMPTSGTTFRQDGYALQNSLTSAARGLRYRTRVPPQIVTGRKVYRVEHQQLTTIEQTPRWLVEFHQSQNARITNSQQQLAQPIAAPVLNPQTDPLTPATEPAAPTNAEPASGPQ